MELYNDIKTLHSINQELYTQAEIDGNYENMQKYQQKLQELDVILDRYEN